MLEWNWGVILESQEKPHYGFRHRVIPVSNVSIILYRSNLIDICHLGLQSPVPS